MRRIMLLWLWAGWFLTVSSASGQGLDWVASALSERSHDFGTVARGSQLHYSFPLVNRTNQDIHILNWKTKCGCTNVSVGARLIPPGTQTTIEATIDTTRFVGPKVSGLWLWLDQPSYVQVDLTLSCFIRGDIVMTPGQIDFGPVRRDKLAPASLTLIYAGGRSDWEVTKMKTQSAKVKAELRETGRTADGQINYSLTANLQPGIPNGYFRDEITLVTNDPQSPSIPVAVVANVTGAVSVTPSIINFGAVRSGQSVAKTVFVRSERPFSITKLRASSGEIQANGTTKGPLPLHTLTLTFKAPARTGPSHATLTVETDIKDEPPAVLKTFATVVP
ncbi:MAG: DUF1573 domain-containing protein [Isosphaeraceae bacterium]